MDDKIQLLQRQKVDLEFFERQQEMMQKRDQSTEEEVRLLKSEMTALQSNAHGLQQLLMGKADKESLGKEKGRVQELLAALQEKADLDSLRQLQDRMKTADVAIKQMQENLPTKAAIGALEDHGARITSLAVAVRAKADEQRLSQLQTKLAKLEEIVEEVNSATKQKVDIAALNSQRKALQDLSGIIREKADYGELKSLQADAQTLSASLEQIGRDVEQKAGLQALEAVNSELQKVGVAVRNKVDTSVAHQLTVDMTAAKAATEQVQRQLDSGRRQQMETSSKLDQLQKQAGKLTESCNTLAKTKADAHNVPHLHPQMLKVLEN